MESLTDYSLLILSWSSFLSVRKEKKIGLGVCAYIVFAEPLKLVLSQKMVGGPTPHGVMLCWASHGLLDEAWAMKYSLVLSGQVNKRSLWQF